MSHVIIGTAGHVDHGKTMLIKALTGEDTDRLQEEKERGISIDLGFAPFDLPTGRRAGVVDVPGHERFINNMLAGIGGIDLVLLVVDVTEGVMPQTREHLAILNLLNIKQGIVVLTKIDLAEEEWVDLVEEEISLELKGTFLEKAPHHRVSVVTGEGIEELKSLIDEMTAVIPPRDENPPLRMPVDRVFTIAGFGTVLTGTLLTGSVKVGEDVEVLPAREKVRVRQLQVHGTKVEEAFAGQRVALNLAHLEKEVVHRGSVIATPGYFSATDIIDARLKLLSGAPRSIKNMTPFHFYLGTGRVVARAFLLDTKELKPGEESLVQFRLDKPLVAHRQDRFIVRSYSPVTTVGGGVVLDPLPTKHKRFRKDVLSKLKVLEEGDPSEYVLQQVNKNPLQTVKELAPLVRIAPQALEEVLRKLIEKEKLLDLDGYYAPFSKVKEWQEKILTGIEIFHNKHNLSAGISRAFLKGSLDRGFPASAYDYLLNILKVEGKITLKGDSVALNGFEPKPSVKEEKLLQEIVKIYKEAKFTPPSLKEVGEKQKIKEEELTPIINYLADKEVLLKVSESLVFHRESYNNAIDNLKELFKEDGKVTLATFRDRLNTSRKYAQVFLEYLDQKKITRREGDFRYPWKI